MKKLFTLFVGMLIASAAWADDSDLYEPMIVASGFTRDVIAEQIDTTRTSGNNPSGVTDYAQSYYDDKVSIHYIYPTKTTIRLKHGDAVDNIKNVKGGLKVRPIDTAFPDDNGGPEDRRINCLSPDYPGLYWMLGPYDVPNALCMRNKMKNKDMEAKGLLLPTGKFEFKNVGCYQKLYFMVVAGGADADHRKMYTRVHYSDGSYTEEEFTFVDHAETEENQRACHDNIFTSESWTNGSWFERLYCFAAVCEMKVETHHLIDSISFLLNDSTDAGIAIFAVTGMTADIAAPASGSSMQTTEITNNSFTASWEPVEGADTYRIDVATDEDFHNMVDGYNNETVIHGTDTIIEGLDADSEYYWRVRAVNSEEGQSASSAPRRVRTESADGPKETNETNHSLKDNDITPLLNTTTNLIINRTLYKDGYLNTLCLPFSLSAEEIALSPIAGCQLYEFEYATSIGDAQLDIHMTATDHIEAGKPYLIQWENTGEVLTRLEFNGVTITTDEGQTIGGSDEVQFVGNINTTGETGMENGNKNHLFLGANNTLYWPNTSNGLKGFRAHFEVPVSGPAAVPRNTPARIVTRQNTATAIENIGLADQKGRKVLEGNKIVIVRNGLKYNVLGQLIK